MRVLLSSLFLLLLAGPGWAAPDYAVYAPQFAAMGYTLGSAAGPSTDYDAYTGYYRDGTGPGQTQQDQSGGASFSSFAEITFGTVNIDPIVVAPAVPELSTWAMMLLGFAGIGLIAYRRRIRTVINPI